MGITLAATGHRPKALWGYNLGEAHYQQVKAALNRFLDTHDVDMMISGMALGFDTLFAETALERDIPLVAAVPFAGQESKWPSSSQRTYRNICDRAAMVTTVSPGGYSVDKMMARNRWMVDHADALVALWNGQPSGTGNCVEYAKRQGLDTFAIDPANVTPTHCPNFTNINQARPAVAFNGSSIITEEAQFGA